MKDSKVRVGDLCFVVNSKYNSGRIVEVTRYAGPAPFEMDLSSGADLFGTYGRKAIPGSKVWFVKSKSIIEIAKFVDGSIRSIDFINPGREVPFSESKLLPIRPEDLDESTSESKELSTH